MLRNIIIVLTLLLAGAYSAFAYYQHLIDQPLNITQEGMILEVQRGDSLHQILQSLQSTGALTEVWPAKLYAKRHDLAGRIRVGEFLIPAQTRLPELFQILSSNQQILHKVTLVEGSTFAEARDRLQHQSKLKPLYAELSDEALMEKVREEVAKQIKYNPIQDITHPEGLIYPDTYYFHKGDTEYSLLVRAHRKLVEELNSAWSKRQKDTPLTSPYDALILASIVEKETGKPSERSEIAGVFIRRLQQGMRLQTDPTVIYGLGERYQGNITRAHLREKTAYNTYRINGLPPTPIALAGKEAIHAALNPKDGKTLYFVAKGDGSHYFSETITEHNRAVRKYQLKRRAGYRSTHQAP